MGVGSSEACMLCISIITSKAVKLQTEDLKIDLYAEGLHQYCSSVFIYILLSGINVPYGPQIAALWLSFTASRKYLVVNYTLNSVSD
jgi:hypothetical protein